MRRDLLALGFCAFAGACVGWLDSRPHWDDTGVTVVVLLLLGIVGAALAPRSAWLVPLLLSIWLPVFEMGSRNTGSLFALVPASLGALIGWSIGRTRVALP